MSDWDAPVLATAYSTFLDNIKARDVDAYTMVAGTNMPTNAKRWDTGALTFENWNGASWDDLILAVAGGGTGAANAANARTNLGLGTMATQNAAAVAITGGTMVDVGITYTVDDSKNIGSNAQKLSKIYIASGIVLPVGPDKYLTS